MCTGSGKAQPQSENGHDKKKESWNEAEQHFSSFLLELAANNDLDGFRKCIEEGNGKVNTVGKWYTRQNGSKQMVFEQRTPAMIAALYGSLDVLQYIVSSYLACGGNLNEACGNDGSTALHCAAAGGSVAAADAAKLLIDSGANIFIHDAHGRLPADVISVSHRLCSVKALLKDLLEKRKPGSDFGDDIQNCYSVTSSMNVSSVDGESAESFSLTSAFEGSGASSVSSPSQSSSPKSPQGSLSGDGNDKVREYLVDPSIPDIKNSIYTTDEFRMYTFKIKPCSRAYSHDWTECPFVHPGENARRRDPRKFHYSCVPCPDFRKGACRRGDACEYAHGVFECWLHPAQYRTRLCKDGTECNRRVCFFAHTTDELRPLFVSTGSAVPSPRSSTYLDGSVMSPPLAPGSPLMLSSFSPSHPVQNTIQGCLGTPPMSPSSSAANTFPQSNIPALHLPGSGMQTSRLRSALNARDIQVNDAMMSHDFDGDVFSEYQHMPQQPLSTQARLNAAVAASGNVNGSNISGKYRSLGLITNLEDVFASECVSSPITAAFDSPLVSQSQPQIQNRMSPQMQLQVHQAAMEAQMQGSLVQSPSKPSFSPGSLSRMPSFRGIEPERQGFKEGPLSPALLAAKAAFSKRDKLSYSFRELGTSADWSDWGSPTGKAEWSIQGDDLSKLRKAASFGFRNSDEPDFSWVQKLVKEGPLDASKVDPMVSSKICNGGDGNNGLQRDGADVTLLSSWIDKLQLDQIVA